MKKKKDSMYDQINGNFIMCGKPTFDNEGNIDGWIYSGVRLSEIKTVHAKLNKFIPEDDDKCIFYTYKDEWYACVMKYHELIDVINCYSKLKGSSHGSEIAGDYTG